MPQQRPAHLLPLAALCALCACGDGVITPSGTPAQRLFSVTGEARGALDAAFAGELRAALTWRLYSDELLACLESVAVDGPLNFADSADLATADALSDCLSFSEAGRTEAASVELETEFPASFTIPVDALPNTALLSGTDSARLGLADLLIYSDDNGTGSFEDTARGAGAFVDRVHGTSRTVLDPAESIAREMSMLVYREGATSPLWKLFNALYGCPDPAQGFSTLTVTVDGTGAPVVCTLDARPLTVTLTPSAAGLACAADPATWVAQRPSEGSWPAGATADCPVDFGGDVLVYTQERASVCPAIRQYSLAGCSDVTSAEACAATAWDERAQPPAWWPCKGGFSAFGGDVVDASPATDAAGDVLFDYRWSNGLGEIPVDDVEIRIVAADGTSDAPDVRLFADALTLVDLDSNGVFNAGDRLRVQETGNPFTTQSTGYFLVQLFVSGAQLDPWTADYYVAVAP